MPEPHCTALIHYRNHRGEVAWRKIIPIRLWWGSVSWHPGNQWLLDATDCEKHAERTFACCDILEWRKADA